MVKINDQLDCCGINEITEIGQNKYNPEKTIIDICKEIYLWEKKGAFLLFTDIKDKTAGNNLAKYIIKNKLGKITKSPSSINPNSKNSLKAYIWTINKNNLKKFAKKNNIEEKEDEY